MITNEQLSDCARIIDNMMIEMVSKHNVTFSELTATVLARLTQLAEDTKNQDVLCGIAQAVVTEVTKRSVPEEGAVFH